MSRGRIKVVVSGSMYYVDSEFLNNCQNKLPSSELKHLGYGYFKLVTPDGNINFNRLDGMKFKGFHGRCHLVDSRPELFEDLLKEMNVEIINL